MREVVIVAGYRTAVGKANRGSLRNASPVDYGAEVIKACVESVPQLDPREIEDLIIGCSFPEAEQGMNFARIVGLKAGLPIEVPGVTVNRFCSSGLQTIAMGAEKIMSGFADVVLAGGIESMSLVPMGGNKIAPNPDMVDSCPEAYLSMGITAENVAAKYNISREEQDEFAVRSQQRTESAQKSGKFKDEIVPVEVPQR
ncbi:MAG: beta-ketoacyl synthase N-terminal-like domain-containing protein, partial [Bacillota bacterium]|nr:beta-ketoacyl synthase N-terminal-like domain-containing protein [Bacillota bacterium]